LKLTNLGTQGETGPQGERGDIGPSGKDGQVGEFSANSLVAAIL
jgi:hypothetical protein